MNSGEERNEGCDRGVLKADISKGSQADRTVIRETENGHSEDLHDDEKEKLSCDSSQYGEEHDQEMHFSQHYRKHQIRKIYHLEYFYSFRL